MQFIVELEPDPHGSTDLTGDAGVVGRWLVEGDATDGQELQLDLKGILYTVDMVSPWLSCSALPQPDLDPLWSSQPQSPAAGLHILPTWSGA